MSAYVTSSTATKQKGDVILGHLKFKIKLFNFLYKHVNWIMSKQQDVTGASTDAHLSRHAATHRMEFQVILMTIVVMYIGTEGIPVMMVLLWTETCRVQ